ncbi:MAG: sugar transferase [Deltaproteobacteria bacterium]|nr:sugar transferase [Deltaproteobacteria bacterium]
MISKYRRALLQALDALCILGALLMAEFFTIIPDLFILTDYTGASTFTLFFYLLFFYILDAYKLGEEDIRDTAIRLGMACVLAILGSAVASYSLDHYRFDRDTLLVVFSFSFVFCLAWRLFYHRNAERLTHPLRVLFVGTDKAGKVRRLLAEAMPRASVLGYVGEAGFDADAGPCLGPSFLTVQVAEEKRATMILLLPDAPLDADIAHELLLAKLRGAMVVDIRSFYEHVVNRLPLSQITEEWLLQEDGFSLNTQGSLRRLKRAMDLFISLGLLVAAAPLMLLTALAIMLESRGPLIYRQTRVGLYEKEFCVHKFRSMRMDAEKGGAVWAQKNDERVTRVGRFIRKVRIDELPQLWDVFKGDMSLIGPRPERPEFVSGLKDAIPFYGLRHSVKPGVTGWAQVCYPYGASEEDARRKLEYDLYYVKNMSLILDFKIILKTVGVVLFPSGAR